MVGAVMIKWMFYLQLSMQSLPIATKFVSLNSDHGKVYSIQHYVINNKTDRHHITEILLKMALNTIIVNPYKLKNNKWARQTN
jgi:hypothetical protein